MRISRLALAAAAVVGLVVAAPVAATADGPPSPEPVATGFVGPFNLAVDGDRLLVADGFTGMIATVSATGDVTPWLTGRPGAAGVAVSADGTIAYTTTVSDEATFTNTDSHLNIRAADGTETVVDLTAHEQKFNPDKSNTYGFNTPGKCLRDGMKAAGQPTSYKGHVDAHAYSVTAYGSDWIVADAGANVLWRVDADGRVSTLTVFPVQYATITAGMAAEFGLPACAAGQVYGFEPVPTDVEVGRDGALYVTTLPGGPEDPSAGARGSVYRVDPRSGKTTLVATGFAGATNLAVAANGDIYVAELFGGTISRVRGGQATTFAELPNVLSLEFDDGTLYAATMAAFGPNGPEGPGAIVKYTIGG